MSAIAAAAARVERNPTDAQKEAGNYRKGHFRWEGLDIAIENPAGGFRRGKDADGKEWEVKLPVHYGYVKGTMGADGDAVDVFINPKPEPGPVYVIDQVDPHTGAFDEHKCLMGFREQIDAVLAYADSYSDGKGRQRIGAISALPLPAFKAWLETRRTKKPLAYDPDRVPLKKREDLAKASPGIAQRLLNTAERIEEDLATRIGRTLAWLSGSPADAVIEAVEQGLPTDAAAEALPTDSITIRMRRELRPLDDAFSGGGKIGDEALPATAGGRRIDVDFDRKNRLVNERLATYKLDLIRQITDDQKETIKRILVDALEEGAPPAVIARSIREQIGLTDSQAQHVANYRAELENLDAGALQRSLRDARYDPTIARAISEQRDLSPDQIDRMVDAYRRRYIAYRAMTIARTEALRAVNTGQRASIEAAGQVGQLDDMVLEKRWIATRDNRTRDSHVDLNGKVVIGLDTPFITQSGAAIRWPHDDQAPADETIRCRCTLAFRLVPRG